MDVRWMTYAEAAQALGVDSESIARRARRLGWQRQPGNDGRARVAIPGDVLAEPAKKSFPSAGPDKSAKSSPEIKALQAEVVDLHERLSRAETGAAEAREALARREGELAGVKLGMEHLQDAATQARREADEARRQAIESQAAADVAKRAKEEAEAALAALRSRGLLARLFNRG